MGKSGMGLEGTCVLTKIQNLNEDLSIYSSSLVLVKGGAGRQGYILYYINKVKGLIQCTIINKILSQFYYELYKLINSASAGYVWHKKNYIYTAFLKLKMKILNFTWSTFKCHVKRKTPYLYS